MKPTDKVTLCMTIGSRPELLDQTLSSLVKFHDFSQVIAVNDFGDQESNRVFQRYFPKGTLISTGIRRGHHAVVDDVYSRVTTPYVFHIEDDWHFDHAIVFDDIFDFLDEHSNITSVCLRELSDFYSPLSALPVSRQWRSLQYRDLTDGHPEWYGYTFNPHIISLRTLNLIAPFTQYRKERHISRRLRRLGKHVVYLQDGGCCHIGDDASVANTPDQVSWNVKFERGIKKLLRIQSRNRQ